MKMDIAYQTAELLFQINAVSLRPAKPFRFSSGILSPIYIDNRLILSYPKIRRTICLFFLDIIKQKIGLAKIALISGTATAAIPYASFISQKLDLPMVYVRINNKDHGKENKIEGKVRKGIFTLAVEDHITTGSSLMANVNTVRKAGGKVNYAIASTTFLLPQSIQMFNKFRLRVFPLTDLKALIKVAKKRKKISTQDQNQVLKWANDPVLWTQKFDYKV